MRQSFSLSSLWHGGRRKEPWLAFLGDIPFRISPRKNTRFNRKTGYPFLWVHERASVYAPKSIGRLSPTDYHRANSGGKIIGSSIVFTLISANPKPFLVRE